MSKSLPNSTTRSMHKTEIPDIFETLSDGVVVTFEVMSSSTGSKDTHKTLHVAVQNA